MGNVNTIQSKIMQLEGGAFQSLFDEYLNKYKFTNIQTLGVQTATNKPTKGTLRFYYFSWCRYAVRCRVLEKLFIFGVRRFTKIQSAKYGKTRHFTALRTEKLI